MLKTIVRAILASTLAIGAFTAPAKAWGPYGHAIVADIAQMDLTPRAKAEVDRLLQVKGMNGMDLAADWADDVDHKPQWKKTGWWHVVVIDRAQAGYVRARDCADGNCATEKIIEMTRVLADKSRSDDERATALLFVLHLVGDLHQPMHATDDHDFRGNDLDVKFFYNGRKNYKTNLHAVWDSGIINAAWDLRQENYDINRAAAWKIARELAAGGTGENGRDLVAAVDAWTTQDHRLGVDVAYANLAPGHVVDDAYVSRALPVIRSQLATAGHRLAWILNGVL